TRESKEPTIDHVRSKQTYRTTCVVFHRVLILVRFGDYVSNLTLDVCLRFIENLALALKRNHQSQKHIKRAKTHKKPMGFTKRKQVHKKKVKSEKKNPAVAGKELRALVPENKRS
ncbi:hypothetical protein CARUB_v10027770mg, partial [Capsella rubella]